MLPLAHHVRDTNGFMKSATVDISMNIVNSTKFINKLDNPTLQKATNTTISEWSSKLVSNKIKVIAIAYNLCYEPLAASSSGQFVSKTPVRFDTIRFRQTEPSQVYHKYLGTTDLYIKSRTFNVPSVNTVTDINSVPNLPLDRPELLNPKWIHSSFLEAEMGIPLQYNANSFAISQCRLSQNHVAHFIPIDCYIDIPDDGNPVSTINLRDCVGEIPEIFFVSTWNQRVPSVPFVLQQNCYVTGQVTILYQDIGNKLSHL